MSKEYWRKLHQRALKEARHALVIETKERTVIAFVIAVVSICLLWLVGHHEGAISELLLRIAGTAAIVFVFPVVYLWKYVTAPEKLDQEANNEIDRLSGELDALSSSSFEVLYDPTDPKFAQSLNGGTRYSICLHVLGTKSIDNPNIRALASEFTTRVFVPEHHPKNVPYIHGRPVPIYEPVGGRLDPDDREFIKLCDLPDYRFLNKEHGHSPLLRVQRFMLEARGH